MIKEKENKIFGRVSEGSVETGITIVLNDNESIEDYPVGALIKIKSKKYEYLAMINDAIIRTQQRSDALLMSSKISHRFKDAIISKSSKELRSQLISAVLIAKMKITDDEIEIKKADTIPSFGACLNEIDSEDIRRFYEIKDIMFALGNPKTPKEIEIEIPIKVNRLIDLSFGIFGKSGSGKTFLGNILAGYIIEYDLLQKDSGEKRIRLLIFDMHSEYGLELRDQRGNKIADGIGVIFKEYIQRYTPDDMLSKNRHIRLFKINIKDITVEDLFLIGPLFGVSQTFLDHLSKIKKILEKDVGLGELWFLGLFDGDALEEYLGAYDDGKRILNKLKNKLSINNLSDFRDIVLNKIKKEHHAMYTTFVTQTSKLRRMLRYPLTLDEDIVNEIIDNLLDKDGRHVIISLGKFEKDTPLYMIIANLIARRLRNKIIKLEEEQQETPNKIIIFLEEAHNFLGRDVYNLSPFGDIAREMRKKGVTLCIIDQKPGELDPNVISMLWTNFVLTLTDKKDVEQAVMGIDKPELYKKIVPTLEKREMLAFGDAVKYPIVVKILDYRIVENKFKEFINAQREVKKEKEEELREQGFL